MKSSPFCIKNALGIIVIVCFSIGAVCFIIPKLQRQMKKWRIERDGRWIARYFPQDGTPASLPTLIADIHSTENITIDKNDWLLVPTNAFLAVFPKAVFYNTNQVEERVLVVMTDRSIVWLKANIATDSK